jgi:lysophospholipase L1-like esterase
LANLSSFTCDGNSITAGTGATSALLNAWPPVCTNLLTASQASHPSTVWVNKRIAISGNTTQQRIAAFAAEAAPLFSLGYSRNVITFFEVVNDIVTNAVNLATAITNVQTWVSLARRTGFSVMLATPTPTTNTGNGANVLVPQFNTWLRANPQWSDYPIVDLAANASLSNPSNLTFYNVDGLHPTDAGYAVMAQLFHDAIAAIKESADPLLYLKRLIYDFDLLESSQPAAWAARVATIINPDYKRIFALDRIRYRYAVYGWPDATLTAVYNDLLQAYT